MTYLSMVTMQDMLRIYGFSRYRDNGHSRHQMVMALFPKDLGENPRNKLKIQFRLERTPKGTYFLIRSDSPIVNNNAVKSTQENVEYKIDEPVSFRVALNPVKRNRNSETPITDQEEQEAWVLTKLSNIFSDIHILNQNSETIKRRKDTKDVIQLLQVDGVANISDVEKLQTVLNEGIGRSKSYGSGLLTVRKLG